MSIEDDEDDTRIWDTREARRALRTLCDEVRKAAEEGLQPPCLAITPTPGTAIVHWNWAGPADVTQRTKQLTAEWSTAHVGCPAFGAPKLTVQSFRELAESHPMYRPVFDPDGPPVGIPSVSD